MVNLSSFFITEENHLTTKQRIVIIQDFLLLLCGRVVHQRARWWEDGLCPDSSFVTNNHRW
jgi:hypothetical protein